ncbi:hypothetical protein [Enterococcus mundtii]|uniref:hypothetical protein n=1 Tax=Enterococcus mundtii TaxID=53346 RepID=UPI00192A0B70|nr:hypothetical protein [Enterococcus mundtii]GKS56460.1 hypothetical protein EMLAB_30750 [Enterococcus mundtii]
MTMTEYETRLIAYRLKRLDEQELIHYQAWANKQVKATKKRGKYEVPFFDTFEKFFNKEKLENKILGKDEKIPRFVNS